MYMDNKLSWKNHVEHTINKVNQRLRLIKRLAGAKWGNIQETMNTTYKTYIKPLMKYGSKVLVTASNSTLKALETT
jgi:bisphosphoglycerate-dependent phosphoglycerate mutase